MPSRLYWKTVDDPLPTGLELLIFLLYSLSVGVERKRERERARERESERVRACLYDWFYAGG